MSENPYQDDSLILDEATLSRKKFMIITHIAEEVMAEYFAEPAKADISMFTSWMHDRLTLRVVQPVWTQPLKEVKFEYPKTVWEHLKKKFAPLWVIQRWPIQYDTIKVNIFAAYPGLAFPKEKHFIHVETRHWDPRVKIERSRRNG